MVGMDRLGWCRAIICRYCRLKTIGEREDAVQCIASQPAVVDVRFG